MLELARQPPLTMHRRLAWLFVAMMLTGCVIGVIVPAGLGWDFANFYDAGRRVAAGHSAELYQPAAWIAGKPPQGKTGFYGTPISALLYVPLAGLAPEAALVLFKIQNVVAFLASFAALFLFHRRFIQDDPAAQSTFAAIFAGLCLIFQPFWTVFRVGGQTTPFVLLLLTLAMTFHTRARFWGSAICVVSALLVKPALAPLVLFLMCVSGLSFLWKTAVTLLIANLLSLALLGWPVHGEFLTLMRVSGQGTWMWYYNSSISIVIDNIRLWAGSAASSPSSWVFTGLIYGMQVGVIGVIAYFTRKGHRERWPAAAQRHFDFMMAVLLFLLWSKTVWEHYLALLFLPLIYIVAVRARFSRSAVRLVAAIFVLSVFQNLVFTSWLRATFAFTTLPALLGIAIFKSAPLLLMLAFLGRYWRELFQSYASWPEAATSIGTTATRQPA